MTFLNKEEITLLCHSFVFNPDTFLKPVDEDNPSLLMVPYQNSEELMGFGIQCDTSRVLVADTDENGDVDYKYKTHLIVWTKSCQNCDESPDIDEVHPGDKIIILTYGNYAIMRKENIEPTH